MHLTNSCLDNMGLRILLSAKELSKGCISFNLGEANIVAGDLLSTGVNFYYSLYHSCVSTISSTSTAIPIEKCVDEWKNRKQLPRFYIPLSHRKTTSLINKLDAKLGEELDNLMNIREYLSYGPNVLYKLNRKNELSKILIYTCKFANIKQEIADFSIKLPSLINRCCELTKMKLGDNNFFHTMFEFYIITDILCKDVGLRQDFVKECWSMIDTFDEKGKIRKMALQAIEASNG